MDLSNLKPAAGSTHNDNFRRGRDMVQETEKQLVKATKVRRHVLVHQE